MYADDAIIFLKPTTRNADNLKRVLANIGEVTGVTSLMFIVLMTSSSFINQG
jgi:hypothetical protein